MGHQPFQPTYLSEDESSPLPTILQVKLDEIIASQPASQQTREKDVRCKETLEHTYLIIKREKVLLVRRIIIEKWKSHDGPHDFGRLLEFEESCGLVILQGKSKPVRKRSRG